MMDKKHLFWIIPLSIMLGVIITIYTFDIWFDMARFEIIERSTEMLQDAKLAWEETPLSEVRVFYKGQFCYSSALNNSGTSQLICPQRNITIGDYI
jgi:hypothetical protein